MPEIVRTSWRLRVAETRGEESLWWDGCTHDPKFIKKPHGWPSRERALLRYRNYAATNLDKPDFRRLELVETTTRETETSHGDLEPDRAAHLIAFANTLDQHSNEMRGYGDAMRESLKRRSVFRFIVTVKQKMYSEIREKVEKTNIDLRRYFFYQELIFCQEEVDVLIIRCIFDDMVCVEIPKDILDMS